MTKPLLIEIGVEELPAIPFLKQLKNIEKLWLEVLEENMLACEFDFFYTPRRLVFWHREFKLSQDDQIQEIFGAPLRIAYKDEKPTPAALGFAKKCGVELSELEVKDDKLYYKKELKGQNSDQLLDGMINSFISKLDFGKSMRWGSRSDSFIRPIRSFCVLLGEELVEAKLFGVKSSKSSYPHRMISYEPFTFDFAGDYFCKLDKNGVVLYPNDRMVKVLNDIKKIEDEHNIKVELDNELLDEVVAITEFPTALLGTFDKQFLELPDEVIIGSMKEHQRYFAVYEDDKLTNKFIVVSNAYTDNFSQIIAGNEKVLRPRLSDAMFFYKNDIKNGLKNDGLKDIVFVDGLGSVYDKILREADIAKRLGLKFGVEKYELLENAIMLGKADLLSEMVYEFTELQGLMGYYYAKIAGEDENVALSIKEQYLPNGEDSALPSNRFSSIIALSNKLDTLLGLFSVGMIPTGSKDPFALRRAASGIVKIVLNEKINFDIDDIFNELSYLYTNLDTKKVEEFFIERLYKIFKVNSSILNAVLLSGDRDILSISQKLDAVVPIVQSDSYKEISSTFKRVANIVKDIQNENIVVDVDLFEEEAEKSLYTRYNDITSKTYTTIDDELEALFSLKPYLDFFFDNVFVNHENEKIKLNRKNLVATVYRSFLKIADFKEISI
jgi:glycyl-tRNA synthetase beta chain